MPHIIVEYAEQIEKGTDIKSLLQAIHQSISGSGLFKAGQIRTRAYPFRYFTNAGGNEPFIHIHARIKSGRDTDNKKQLSEVILSAVAAMNIAASAISVEIIDMDRDSYAKLS